MAAKTRNLIYYPSYSDGDTEGPVGTKSISGDAVFVSPDGFTGTTSDRGWAIRLLNKTGFE